MRRSTILGLALLCIALPGAAAAPRTALEGELRVRHRFDSSGGVPIEGYVNFFRLRDGSGRLILRRRSFHLTRRLAPGRYRLTSYQRTCNGNCGQLGSPGPRCSRRFRVGSRELVRLRLIVNYSTGCRFVRRRA